MTFVDDLVIVPIADERAEPAQPVYIKTLTEFLGEDDPPVDVLFPELHVAFSLDGLLLLEAVQACHGTGDRLRGAGGSKM